LGGTAEEQTQRNCQQREWKPCGHALKSSFLGSEVTLSGTYIQLGQAFRGVQFNLELSPFPIEFLAEGHVAEKILIA
jgi:hypothetical protein